MVVILVDEEWGKIPREFLVDLPRIGERVLYDNQGGFDQYIKVSDVCHDLTLNQIRIFGDKD